MKSIVFNTEDVRAILDGRKRATCRPIPNIPDSTYNIEYNHQEDVWEADYGVRNKGMCLDLFEEIKPPRFSEGDIAFVKETFTTGKVSCGENPDGTDAYFIEEGEESFIPKEWAIRNRTWLGMDDVKWKSAIHMPREAARIFLKVNRVYPLYLPEIIHLPDLIHREGYQTIEEFRDAWDRNLSKKNKCLYGWGKSPWVWVYEFKRAEEPKE